VRRRFINIVPSPGARMLLAAAPFALIVVLYLLFSAARHAENANDKILPPVAQMADAMHGAALEQDKRTGKYQFWEDTAASLKRFGIAIGIATAIGLTLGLIIGLIPAINALCAPLIAAFSMVPPMAILPILFIVFGLGELSKVVLIVIGVAPCLVRDLTLKVGSLPREQLVKAQSLGASTWQILLRVALPQALPRLFESLRLNVGPAFLFLISAEAISAEDGLGYRIFLVRRYLAMDTILPYVIWIALLAYLMDFALARGARRLFPWAYEHGT
jgi:NitT/TauT family transport system permease protein